MRGYLSYSGCSGLLRVLRVFRIPAGVVGCHLRLASLAHDVTRWSGDRAAEGRGWSLLADEANTPWRPPWLRSVVRVAAQVHTQVRAWEIESWQCVHVLPTAHDALTALDADAHCLYTGGRDNKLRVWSLKVRGLQSAGSRRPSRSHCSRRPSHGKRAKRTGARKQNNNRHRPVRPAVSLSTGHTAYTPHITRGAAHSL